MTPKQIRHKIDYEIIVDCYDEEEIKTGWFYFFNDEIEYPFEAEMEIKDRKGNKKMTAIDVIGVESNDGGFGGSEIRFEVRPKGSEIIMEANISKLKNIKGNKTAKEAFEIWRFWKSGKY